ncbi:hypothetical protein Trydic_g21110 [Trypoxylus dichotomus]
MITKFRKRIFREPPTQCQRRIRKNELSLVSTLLYISPSHTRYASPTRVTNIPFVPLPASELSTGRLRTGSKKRNSKFRRRGETPSGPLD